ncbi:YdcF family protein [Alteribacillus persepolensis]|nr:YdcF family protein [Alteribacillus persepolensis]
MKKKVWKKAAIDITAVIVVLVGYAAYSIWSFSMDNQLVRCDAAIVLGAAAKGNEPSPVFRERINHSIRLYEAGYVDKIIFTGGKSDGSTYAEAEAARKYAVERNVHSDDIYIETQSTITEENLEYADDIASEHNLDTFLIVSDPLHMKRAITMADHMGMTAYSSPTQSSAYETLQTKIPFFFRELFFYIGYLLSLPFR